MTMIICGIPGVQHNPFNKSSVFPSTPSGVRKFWFRISLPEGTNPKVLAEKNIYHIRDVLED